MRSHNQGTECRAERQGVQCRNAYGNCHRQSELCVERASGAAHEAHGDEHRHEHQGRGDDG